MHNSYIRGGLSSGQWSNYVVTGSDFEKIDTLLYQSINGDVGGTWTPAATITIGGSGLDVSSTNGMHISGGLLVAYAGAWIGGGQLTVTGATYHSAAFNVVSGISAAFGGPVTFGSASSITMTAGATITLNSTAISGVATFDTGNITFGPSGQFDLYRTTVFHNPVSAYGTVTFTGVTKTDLTGVFIDRFVIFNPADSSVTYGSGTDTLPKEVIFNALSQHAIIYLVSTNCVGGEEVEFFVTSDVDPTKQIYVYCDAALTLSPLGYGTGQYCYAKIKYTTTAGWLILKADLTPP